MRAPDGALPRLGPRGQLTLVPGALSPEPSASSGSRFSALPEDEDEDLEMNALAVEVASNVLLEDRVVSRDDVHRPAMSDSDLAQEFWYYVGFPTRASRFWERGSSEDGGDDHGKSSSVGCRSQVSSSPEKMEADARA